MTTTTDDRLIVPEFEGLTFDEGPHIYRLDGIEIPSVSEIMEPIRAAHYAGISDKTLENAANKGTAVHNAIENFLKFEIEDVSAEHYGYFAAFMDWYRYRHPELIGSEIRMYHKILRYGGTCDLLCIIDEKVWLIDFKTTYTISEMSCGVQLEGYAQAFASFGYKIDQKMILHLKRDGCWKEYLFPAKDPDRWRVFGACKIVHDYISSSK